MRRLLMIGCALLLPWLALMLKGRMLQGLLCLVLQITILGWIPAAIWALMVVTKES